MTTTGFSKENNRFWLRNGLHTGVPIGLGYFAVSFALGIAAKQSGFTSLSAGVTSLLCLASAGEYAGFKVIASNSGFFAMALAMLVINARYFLMSASLSQKISERTATFHRFFMAQFVTDEIFGAASVTPEVNPCYIYGMAIVAAPMWTLGTALGVFADNLLPADIAQALGVCLYGMFLAIIIPEAKKNRVIAGFVALSFLCSYGASVLPLISRLSEGMRIILLTIVLSALAAALFPREEEAGEPSEAPTDAESLEVTGETAQKGGRA
jgi:predicted branched-subunit amino acid permease